LTDVSEVLTACIIKTHHPDVSLKCPSVSSYRSAQHSFPESSQPRSH